MIQAKTTFQGARVLNLLIANERINGKYLKNVALLNGDIIIESPISMKSVSAYSLYTDYPISTINFNNYYNNVLWINGMEQQVIQGKWTVKNVNVKDNVYGNGLINGLNVNEIQENFHKHLQTIKNVTSNYADFYQKTCNEIQYNVNVSTQENVHIMKYFERVTFEKLAAQSNEEIFSSFAFETPAGVNYLAINRNCTTWLFMWQQEKEDYVLMERLSLTGIVYNWLAVHLNDEVFVITNSKMELPCNRIGTNIWKVYNGELVFLRNIRQHNDVLEMHTNTKKTTPSFYLLLNNDVVLEYDVFGYQLNHWQLLVGRGNYNFLSDDLELGVPVALCDGKTLITLESRQSQGSKTRRHLVDVPTVSTVSHLEDSPITYINQISLNIPRKRRKFLSTNEILSLPRIPSVQLRSTDNTSLSDKLKTIGLKVKTDLDERFKNFGKLAIKNVTTGDESNKLRNLQNFPVTGSNTTVAPESRVVNLKVIENKNETQNKVTNATHKDNKLRNIPIDSSTSPPEPEMNKTKIKDSEKSLMDKISDFFTKEKIPELAIVSLKQNTSKDGVENKTKTAKESGSVTASSEQSSKAEEFSTRATNFNNPSEQSSSSLGTSSTSLAPETTVSSSILAITKESTTQSATEEKTEETTEEKTTQSTTKESTTQSTTEGTTQSTTIESIKQSTTEELTQSTSEESTQSTTEESTTQPLTELSTKQPTTTRKSSTISSEVEKSTSVIPNTSFTPRIIMPQDNVMKVDDNVDETFDTKFPEDITPATDVESDVIGVNKEGNIEMGERVAYEVPTGGVRTTENAFLPEKGAGELLVLYVGPNNQKKKLYAVSQTRESTIKGNYNVIRVS